MADATIGQVLELLYKRAREEMELFAKIKSGEIDREELQQMIIESERSPKERLVRTLVKKAEQAIHGQYNASSGAHTRVFAEICAVYELLGEAYVADKLTYRAGNHVCVYLERVKALCEKNNLERARMLVTLMQSSRTQQYAWLAISDKSQEEADYNQIKPATSDFKLNLAIAQARAKTDGGAMLKKMRNELEKQAFANSDYSDVLAALAKDYIRQGLFAQARIFTTYLYMMVPRLIDRSELIDLMLTLAQASKESADISRYRDLNSETQSADSMIYLAHIAAITGQEKDFITCHEAIHKHIYPVVKSNGYSALALAYATCGNISKAREIASTMISSPKQEAETFARMAQIVYCSQD